uniref:PX domain-containing protein n=2 Tax=Phytophthora ramorum TaxID=164328 RepID=H3H5Z9_PHYRM
MRMMHRSHSLEHEEMRPASPACKPGAPSMLLVPDLQPLRMWPCHYAKAADALGFLKAIDHVEVNETVKRQGRLCYVVQVFLKNPEIRIPTSRNSATRRSAADGSPPRRLSVTELPQDADYQVEREFSEFVKLRYNVWVHAQQPRPTRGCIYCDDITAFVGDSSKRPAGLVDKIWATKTHRKDMMQAYLNRMVALAIGRGGDGQRSPHCHGFDHIPYRLVRFLKKTGEVNHLR